MVAAIEGAGTPESEWLPFLEKLDLPALSLDPLPRRAVVVAPHPDDEILGVGGLLAALSAARVPVALVAVTDGEASHPGSVVLTRTELVERRVLETDRALAALGVDARVRRLREPDGGAQALENPTYEALLDLRLTSDDVLLAPWSRDGHPDHESVGRAAERAALDTGARLLAYPIWAWHWDSPTDSAIPWDRSRSVALDPGAQEQKAAAIKEFRTQVEPLGPLPADAPVLPPEIVVRFTRDLEVVFA